jgi:hypothetical protein
MDADLIPLIPIAYLQRVRELADAAHRVSIRYFGNAGVK